MINCDAFKKLIEICEEKDLEALEMIDFALKSFIDYYDSIYRAETYKLIYSYKSVNEEDHKYNLTKFDKARHNMHNSLLANLSMLNKLTEEKNLPCFFDGIISEEKPYRRIAANEVIEFIHGIIDNRA